MAVPCTRRKNSISFFVGFIPELGAAVFCGEQKGFYINWHQNFIRGDLLTLASRKVEQFQLILLLNVCTIWEKLLNDITD
jgi:hypothetical protein